MSRLSTVTGMRVLALVSVVLIAATAYAKVTKNEGDYYIMTIETSSEGDSAVATVTIKGKTVYHCNKAFPWKISLKPSPGVTFEKDKYRKDDAEYYEEDKMIFKIPYKITAGAETVFAFFKGSLCDNKQCQTVKIDFTWPAK